MYRVLERPALACAFAAVIVAAVIVAVGCAPAARTQRYETHAQSSTTNRTPATNSTAALNTNSLILDEAAGMIAEDLRRSEMVLQNTEIRNVKTRRRLKLRPVGR